MNLHKGSEYVVDAFNKSMFLIPEKEISEDVDFN